MTISGMTGFARAEGEHAGQRWIWELRSVNGRGLDLKLRLPPGFDALEPQTRAAANAKFKRGSVQASLNLARDPTAAPPIRIDLALVERLLQAGETFEGRVEKPRWDGLLAVRGVVQSEDTAELSEAERAAFEAALMAGFNTALEGLAAARQSEGRSLAAIFSEAADRMDALIAAARTSASAAPTAALERIRQRLEALAGEAACTRLTARDLARFERLHADMVERFRDGDWLGYSKLNRRIHEAIFEAAGKVLVVGHGVGGSQTVLVRTSSAVAPSIRMVLSAAVAP